MQPYHFALTGDVRLSNVCSAWQEMAQPRGCAIKYSVGRKMKAAEPPSGDFFFSQTVIEARTIQEKSKVQTLYQRIGDNRGDQPE